jgi:hypothetical protein
MYHRELLGIQAASYVRLVLEKQSTLWGLFSDLEFEAGTVFTYLPYDVGERSLLHFGWPILRREDLEEGLVDWDFRSATAAFVRDFLIRSDHHLAVFRENTIPPHGRLDVRPPLKFFKHTIDRTKAFEQHPVLSTEIYYYATSEDAKYTPVETFMEAGARGPFCCALLRVAESITAGDSGAELPAETLSRFAACAAHVIVSAYDEDALLIWSAPGE